jgi:hypothetical protein
MERFKAFWTTERIFDAVLVASVIFITIWELHPNLVFSSTLLTGGDTGSHLAMPAYLRTTGNPFNFTPWYPGWFAGIPAYTYYFVLPDVLATFASYVIGFAVAFKLATVLGSVLMPITAYAMARLFRAPRPIPAALALATLPFLFDATFTIDGGNLFSTMAGEYAFSLSLALALLTIGLFARGMREGRGLLAGGALTQRHVGRARVALALYVWAPSRYCFVVRTAATATAMGGAIVPRPHIRRVWTAGRTGAAVGVGLLCLAFAPFFFDTAATTNSTGFLSMRESPYSVIFTILLALFTIGRDRSVGVVPDAATVSRRSRPCADRRVLFRGGALRARVDPRHDGLRALSAPRSANARRTRGIDSAATSHARCASSLGAGAISLGLSAWWLCSPSPPLSR